MKSEQIFDYSLHRISLNSITDTVIDLYNIYANINENEFYQDDIKVSYKLIDDKFHIKYKNIEYEVDKELFIFFNEEKKILGKAYNIAHFKRIVKALIKKYEIYDYENNIRLKTEEDFINNKNRKFILKEKTHISEINLSLLNSKRKFDPKQNEPIKIPKSELSPIPLKEFHLKEKDIYLILKNRNKLITYINNFMNLLVKAILIIYGCDGIGKTVTYIYLSNLFNDYKILYFNLKLIMSDEKESYNLFIYEIMRYFTICQETENKEDENKYNYEKYLE